MQFLAPTWDRFQVAAPGHVTADVYDPEDAIYSAADYLCNLGAGTTNVIRLRQAVYGYNHSWAYVDDVLGWADVYRRDPHVDLSNVQPMALLSLGGIDFGQLAYSAIGNTLYSFDGYLVDLLDRLWAPLVVGEDNLGGGKQLGGVLEVDNSKLQLAWEISLAVLIVVYFIRLVMIWVLVAVAPFAFAATILPGGQAVAVHWAKLTFTAVFLKFLNTLVFLTFVFMATASGTGLYNELLVLGMLFFMILVPRFLMRAMAEPGGLASAVRTTWIQTSGR
jgi:hypothetical protein